MEFIRRALLSIVASTALIGAAAVFARNLPPVEANTPAVAIPESHLPPMYFGPTYSAAAVYAHIRPQEVTPRARIRAGRRALAVAPRSPWP